MSNFFRPPVKTETNHYLLYTVHVGQVSKIFRTDDSDLYFRPDLDEVMSTGSTYVFEYFSAAFVMLCWNFRKYMGARNRVGIGLSYRPARLHRLAESIPGFLKSLKIPSLMSFAKTSPVP